MDEATAEQIGEIARLYYLEDRSKVEIGQRFGLSRFKVARLLEQGRQEGIVHIEIRGGNAYQDLLSTRLATHLGLRSCLVVDSGGSEIQIRERIAQAAADQARTLLEPGDTFGISWGRTMRAIGERLVDLPPSLAVQLTGTVGNDPSQSPVEVLRSITADSSVRALAIFAPLFAGSAQAASVLRADPAIASTLAHFPELKLAVMSVGSWRPSITQLRHFLSDADVAHLDEENAQAELLGIFLDADGRVIDGDLADRRISASADDLLRIPHVIAAAGGVQRAPAIAAAARSGLLTTLVTDDQAALALLELAPVEQPALRHAGLGDAAS